ncbi:MAG: hypothetical protein Q9222_007544 [Ikaeria aurantiellina]
MSWRPPSSTHPDQSSYAYAFSSHPERGGDSRRLPSLGALSKPLLSAKADPSSDIPPPVPMQPTYIAPSPYAHRNAQHVFPHPHTLLPSSSEFERFKWGQQEFDWRNSPSANRYVHQRPQDFMPPYTPMNPSQYPAQSSQASRLGASNPAWLEPSPYTQQPRIDPFTSRGQSAYGSSTSPTHLMTARPPASAHGGSPPSRNLSQSQAVNPQTPPQHSEDRTMRYNLSVRQQPLAARACGMGERDRRVVDPPPIVQLSLQNFDSSSPADLAALKYGWNILHCALIDSSGRDITSTQDPHDPKKMSRRLMGTIVSSPFIGTDPAAPPSMDQDARTGCFFIFPDLSCRQTGHYRLRFTLMQVDVPNLPEGSSSMTLGVVESDFFEVFLAKDFPGMRASTALTKELKRQGARVSIKKGNEGKAEGKSQKSGSSYSGEDASEMGWEQSPRRKRH